MGPDLRQLRYFAAVVEEGNFTAAARRLHLTQQSLSSAIAVLERQMNVTLLERDPRIVRPTPDGDFLYQRGVDLLARADELAAALNQRAAEARTTLKVGLWVHGAAELTGPILRAFHLAHPETTLSVRPTAWNPVPEIVSGALDVALVTGPYEDERLRSDALFDEPRVAAVPYNHPLADADVITTADLAEERFSGRRADEPPQWDARFALVEERNGDTSHRHTEPNPSGIPAIVAQMVQHRLVFTVAASSARTAPSSGLFFPRITDVPVERTQISLLSRQPARSPAIAEFRRSALTTTRTLIDLIPGGTLLDDPPTNRPHTHGDQSPPSSSKRP
jgi:DNA-binding transcriptional LysR family regulator